MDEKKKWYKKIKLDSRSIQTLGIKISIYESASEVVHEDDIQDISDFLGVSKTHTLDLLYKECESPRGIVKGFVN